MVFTWVFVKNEYIVLYNNIMFVGISAGWYDYA